MTETVTTRRVEAIREALLACGQDNYIVVCHGYPYCDRPSDQPPDCPWCHTVWKRDGKTAEQVEQEIQTIQRGH